MSAALAEARQQWDALAPIKSAQKAAKVAFDAACRHPSARDQVRELSADLTTVRRQSTVLLGPPQGQPDYRAALRLWQDAKKRWQEYATSGMAPRQLTADPFLLARQRDQAAAHMSALGARGIHLSVADDGAIIAKPSVLLLDVDRRRLRENRAILAELLGQEERL